MLYEPPNVLATGLGFTVMFIGSEAPGHPVAVIVGVTVYSAVPFTLPEAVNI